MIPYFSIEFFKIGPLTIYIWGFFVSLAFLVGLILSLRAGKKIGIAANKIISLIIFVYLGAIIGSRLFFVLQWPRDFFADPLMFFRINTGGMMFYGGLVGGILAGWMYIRKISPNPSLLKRGVPPFEKGRLGGILLNMFTPIIPLALAIGRIGCFLLNDHQGGLTNLPWAILWPDGALRHPVALYLILFDLALAGFLWWWGKRAPKFYSLSLSKGKTLSLDPSTPPRATRGFAQGINASVLFLFFYPLGRFFLDFTRDPSADPHYWGLATSQWISLSLLTFILLYYIIKRSRVI